MKRYEKISTNVAIIGAGFSGICMAIQLQKAGINDYCIFEKTDGISGTWHKNDYPGASCDIPSYLYCYSFELNPNWSSVYPTQSEIKKYVEQCVEKYQIKSQIHFGKSICRACFDEEKAIWKLITVEGTEISARVVVSACGLLDTPNIPDIEGLKNFRGTVFHSSRWNHNDNLANKKVAIIGSAASAVQISPQVAPAVEKLNIFQRSPNYIIPRRNRCYLSIEKTTFRYFPLLLRFIRTCMYFYRDLTFSMFLTNGVVRKLAKKISLRHLQRQVPNLELRAKLTPKYALGCKRILISDDFYPTLSRKNVELITAPISRIVPRGIITTDDKSYEVDSIVMATGFETVKFLSSMEIIGLNNIRLQEQWSSGPQAYYGVSVANFPNFFLLLGPNTGLAHNSIIFMIEVQVQHILRCIKKLRDNKYIVVKKCAMEKFNHHIHEDLKNTVWQESCSSWYKTKEGKIPAIWPYSCTKYWYLARKPNPKSYDLI
ncbi:flavin-containing monooxygenase [Candidatus Uabimicrobium sp. HlEnr_7]|uniref:flavin-containing monooxygenase n=1 Tax=Candidatus Uabimicrobium helgolandensis TaxID=3095367 RepID=UPI003557DC1C